ncbi:hypothetical protein BDZ89DRAFT_638617 [Hymenopellis radicata]|nr:hypothetical protein BDZ89DRAFT_638617 [Hymenopellis radicata]
MENFDDAQFALASLEYFLRRHKDIWLTILRAPSFVTLALANWKFVRKDAEYANEDVPPGLSVATAMLSPPTEMSHRVLQFLFNSVTVFPSIRTLLRLIKTQHDVQVRFEVPEQPTLSKEDLKPRFLNDLAQRFAGSTPEGVIDSLSSGPLYFDGSVHPEASSMVEADSQSISDLSDFPKAVGMTRKPCFCCHYLGQAMGYDLPDTRGIVLPWSPPPSLPPQILTEMWQRLRLLYNDLLDSFTLKLQKGLKPSEFERIDGLNEGSRARYYKLLNKGLWKP